MPRHPFPAKLESGAVPTDDRLWLHENQCSFPFRPKPQHGGPKQSIGIGEPNPWMLFPQDGKLLPQGQILQEQIAARITGSDRQYEQKPQRAQRRASLTRKTRRNHKYLF
jgi:hypothetical protein